MATGLSIPLRAGPNGGSVLTSGDEQSSKIVTLALADNDNDNAFQQNIGLGTNEVFAVSNPSFRGRVLNRLTRVFNEFERRKLYRLQRDTIRWEKGKEGEQILRFRYKSIESDRSFEFERTFTRGSY
jgi:hypothetical protein